MGEQLLLLLPSIDWQLVHQFPEKILFAHSFRPFASISSTRLRYVEVVTALHRKPSTGVYIYGWQPADDDLPLFYIGSSVGHLYGTFTRHFTGKYTGWRGIDYPRPVVPRHRLHTVRAMIILAPEDIVHQLEHRVIATFAAAGQYIENLDIRPEVLMETLGYFDEDSDLAEGTFQPSIITRLSRMSEEDIPF